VDILADESDVEIIETRVECCRYGDMAGDCVHGRVAGDDTTGAIAVVDVEFNGGQSIVNDGADFGADLVANGIHGVCAREHRDGRRRRHIEQRTGSTRGLQGGGQSRQRIGGTRLWGAQQEQEDESGETSCVFGVRDLDSTQARRRCLEW
jgi:hypothetical protein